MLSVRRPDGIDPTKGVGTAYEGVVKVPRPGGIRKGWIEQCVVVCDFKLFLYDMNPSRGNQASLSLNQVIDMRSHPPVLALPLPPAAATRRRSASTKSST